MLNLATDAPLGSRVVRVAKMHRRWVADGLETIGLHVGQDLTLMQLHREEGMRQTSLALALGVELPTVHKTVARLGAAGFVERHPDPSDARSALIRLTSRGYEACVRIREIWKEADQRLSAELSQEDAVQLQDLLDVLIERTERQ